MRLLELVANAQQQLNSLMLPEGNIKLDSMSARYFAAVMLTRRDDLVMTGFPLERWRNPWNQVM